MWQQGHFVCLLNTDCIAVCLLKEDKFEFFFFCLTCSSALCSCPQSVEDGHRRTECRWQTSWLVSTVVLESICATVIGVKWGCLCHQSLTFTTDMWWIKSCCQTSVVGWRCEPVNCNITSFDCDLHVRPCSVCPTVPVCIFSLRGLVQSPA